MSGRLIFVAAALVIVAGTMPAHADKKAGYDAYQRGEYDAAVRVWRPLAIAGDAEAQYNMGQAYWLGRGVAEDQKMAEDWYRRASEQGEPKARDAYGLLLFQTGRRQESLPFIEESAGRGMPQAQYVYATLLFNGDLVPKDWVRSYALMTRASAGKVAAASAGLAQLDRFIPLDQRQRGLMLARAFELADAKPDTGSLGEAIPAVRTPPIRAVALPPSQPVKTAQAPVVKPPVIKLPVVKPVLAKPAPVPAAPFGNWKVQLGAFGERAKAAALWGTMRTRVAALGPYQSYIVPAGTIHRLQAGPLTSRAAADKLCAAVKAAGNACLPVAP